MSIVIDLTKAKTIAHTMRRQKRAEEFAPLDDIISKQLPNNDLTKVEASRQAIRDKYAKIQNDIDAANTVEDLLTQVQLFK